MKFKRPNTYLTLDIKRVTYKLKIIIFDLMVHIPSNN